MVGTTWPKNQQAPLRREGRLRYLPALAGPLPRNRAGVTLSHPPEFESRLAAGDSPYAVYIQRVPIGQDLEITSIVAASILSSPLPELIIPREPKRSVYFSLRSFY